jgi:hypothetical protein
MKRFLASFLFALLLTSFAAVPALAEGGPGHIYGVVFVDNDGNGQWNNEPGVSNVAVYFQSGDTKLHLGTAWTDNLTSPVSTSWSDNPADMQCSHLDEDHIGIPKGCNGTVGLIPTSGWWKVWVDTSGTDYEVTSKCGSVSNPCNVPSLELGETWESGDFAGAEWFEIGLTRDTGSEDTTLPAVNGQRVFIATPDPSLEGPYLASTFVK